MTDAQTRVVPVEAIKNLADHQQQLDMDGCMVGVSRQALDETLAYITGINSAPAAPVQGEGEAVERCEIVDALSDLLDACGGQTTDPEWAWQERQEARRVLSLAIKGHDPEEGEAVAWRHCRECNSQRRAETCCKCGGPTKTVADGWEYPAEPDIERIRELAKEKGYAVGFHGSRERDLDLIAAPWVEGAVSPLELAHHIAAGLGGEVVDFERQDKPHGRWSCNIHTPDWTKLIDLSVCPRPAPSLSRADAQWLDCLLERHIEGGHCGEGSLERQQRRVWNERIERVRATLSRSTPEDGEG